MLDFEGRVNLGAYYDTGVIEAGADHKLNYFLRPGQTVEFHFVGNGRNSVEFSVVDPDGDSVIARSRVFTLSGEFSAIKPGPYQVRFNNSFSFLTSKRVNWFYRILR